MTLGYLLDTSVVWMLAPGKLAMGDDLQAWFRAKQNDLYLSAVTIAEIEQGIFKLHRLGGAERAGRLAEWLDALLAHSAQRILPLDAKTARIIGAVSDRAIALGRHPGFADVAIAGTAIAHDLHLLTRNGKHFQPLGVAFSDPFEVVPPG